jgi:RNA polymerase sigma-70 factor (ECF subfamily)
VASPEDQRPETILKWLREEGEPAMKWLFEEYYTYLYQTIYRLVPDRGVCEDLTQETFFELWKKRQSLQIRQSIKAYLRRSAINRTLNFIRDQRIKTGDAVEDQVVESRLTSALEEMEHAELESLINTAIEGLPDRCRQVFVLSRFEKKTYPEIANDLGLSVKTVENQISKALKLLRNVVGPYLGREMILLLVTWLTFL